MNNICHCGYTEDNHNFRHSFEGKIKVRKDTIERFTVNALEYPLTTGEKCSFPECKTEPFGHSPVFVDVNLPMEEKEKLREKYRYLVEHVYSPIEYKYRNIRLILSEESTCNHIEYDKDDNFVYCGKKLKDHKGNTTHHFTTYVHIDNLSEKDKVYIEDGDDEDRKIIWKRV